MGWQPATLSETVCVLLLLDLSDSESEQVTISFPEGYIFNSKVYLRVVFFFGNLMEAEVNHIKLLRLTQCPAQGKWVINSCWLNKQTPSLPPLCTQSLGHQPWETDLGCKSVPLRP